MAAKRILVAESDRETRERLAQALRDAGYATWEVGTGREALKQVQMERPDIVIIGLVLPDIGGNDLARLLSSSGSPESPLTLVQTASHLPQDATLAIGGSPEQPVLRWSHIDEAVTAVNERFDVSEENDPERYSEPLKFRNIVIDPGGMTLEIDGNRIELTQTEFRFLHVLALNGERTCTRDELRRLVWGEDGEVIGRTIDVLVSRLRSKITAASGRDLISTVRGIGYRFCGEQTL